ncbi:hypothetical protein OGAPHI_000100 [Ogataea philodendri]|uniref:Regulator of phospholipase D SRF1 n=1 Tax=Ogataea philodendri TaxID=1378263 RepID=A0A9P8TAS3_9ASCO|nr:uncharacterized protein OGAPHI_000100 [Ogataea philodendri]KAH3671914.1 hypothetical protein OGAPHI_000100 [Ogataea philodendri]
MSDSNTAPASSGSGDNSQTLSSGMHLGPDVFQKTPKHYRHKIQPVPAYVLDGVVRGDDTFRSKDRDLALGPTYWSRFLSTFRATDAYAPNQVSQTNSDSVFDSYQLDQEWKGEEKLNRLYYGGPESSYMDSGESNGNNSGPYDKTKYRSHAGFWISENKKEWKPWLGDIIMNNSYIPLFFRIFTLFLSCVALGLAARIIVLSNHLSNSDHVSQQPSSIMAVVVQSVAILYLFYISYDEFTSQPLGLRDPQAKLRLIMCELLFVIFSSANLALSFNSLYDSRWVCTDNQMSSSSPSLLGSICDRQRTLAAFLFIILVVWCITFTISIIRVVQMVNRNDQRLS